MDDSMAGEHAPRDGRSIVWVPIERRLARRRGAQIALRAIGLLPALVATPQRALFTAGVALGIAAPPIMRLVAMRTIGRAFLALTGSRALARPQLEELVLEQFQTTRLTIRRKR